MAPDVWHHRLKADGPSLCAVRKRQGEENYCWLTPVLIKQTVPTDDTSGGVEMYRDCYTMKLAYPCEADGCRCGSGCLRTRPDCNRTADEDSYSNCDVIPHSGLHTIERWRNKVDAMVTGRVAPIILLAVWVSSLGFAGRSNARRALDSNPLM